MQVLVATKNSGKLREFERILSPLGLTVIGMEDAGIQAVIEENGTTFLDNAIIKATTLHQITGKAVISDDSGLCVDALDGRPGVYSARYGGEDLDYKGKIALLLGELQDVPPQRRTASYQCVICFVDEHSRVHTFEGHCPGTIGYTCRGERGFGYDPIFYVGERSIAEFENDEKDEISHRGRALQAFGAALPAILKP